jgi:putative membrane protein
MRCPPNVPRYDIENMKRIFFIALFFIISALGLSFSLLNAETVTLKYYFGDFSAPLSLVLVLCLALGAILGVLSCSAILVRSKRDLGKLNKSIKMAEKEVTNLRALPLKDKH